ncbi:MAG TPA: zinc ribbon domain-containing protein [Pyrinomonadaceae bacterium]|jgi:hypothetical protein|nr:zinc ribbon domain-containing protein [Pyrinomonadaceae bacterium]
MYCPQCGTESSSGQQYCRSCGANLRVIAKAVTLSEAIARSDRGPLPKIKEMMKSVKIEQVTEEITRALDQMNKEIARSSPPESPLIVHHRTQDKPWWLHMKESQTPEQRREHHFVKGTISFFSGIALMIFLYYFSTAFVLKIPPEQLARIPFDLEPVLHIIWLVGLIPALSGLGHIIAGLLVQPAPAKSLDAASTAQQPLAPEPELNGLKGSVTEHTTEILDWKVPARRTNEIKE